VIDGTSDEGETPDSLEGNIEFNDVVFYYPARPNVQVGSVSMATIPCVTTLFCCVCSARNSIL